jgi:hypothetical protein
MINNSKNDIVFHLVKDFEMKAYSSHSILRLLIYICFAGILSNIPVSGECILTGYKLADFVSENTGNPDNLGQAVAIWGNRCVAGAWKDNTRGTGAGAAYILEFDGSRWIQQAKLCPQELSSGDLFGCSVSIHDNVCVVGAYGDSSMGLYSGAAYVFVFDGSQWVQQAKLSGSAGQAGDFFGHSVSVFGSLCLVGAHGSDVYGANSGAVYVFSYNGSDWSEQAVRGADDSAPDDWFGYSVSLYGQRFLAGAYGSDSSGASSGAAYVFTLSGNNWIQEAKLTAEDAGPGDNFGCSVSLWENHCIIGAMYDDDAEENSGSAYIFAWDGLNWISQAKLLSPDGSAFDNFGYCVSISSSNCVVGIPGDDDKGSTSGSAWTFALDGSQWNSVAKIVVNTESNGSLFAQSVGIYDDTLVAGAPRKLKDGIDSGAVYLYKLACCPGGDFDGDCDVDLSDFSMLSSSWLSYEPENLKQEQKIKSLDADASDRFGCSVSTSNDNIVIGAFGDSEKAYYSGAAYIFNKDGKQWRQTLKLTAPDAAMYDRFGESVSVWENHCIIGAYGKAINKLYSAGVAYAYYYNGSQWVYKQKLTPSDLTSYKYFGDAISIYGNTCIISGHGGRSAYIFQYNGSTWSQTKKLTASSAKGVFFGNSVSIWGNNCIVGDYADSDAGSYAGAVYIFQNLSQEIKLTASDAQPEDEFGFSLGICGDYCIVGAASDDDKGVDSGSAYIFHYDGNNWTEQAKLTASDGKTGDMFGYSVTIRGDYCIVGAIFADDCGESSGAVYWFRRQGSNWVEIGKLSPSGLAIQDIFGYSTALSGNRCVVGAGMDSNPKQYAGSAYIFEGWSPMDLTGDHAIDIYDLSEFVTDWLQRGTLFP